MKISHRRLWIVLLACLGMALVNGCTCAEEPAPPPQPPAPAARPAPEPAPLAARPGPGTVEEQLAREIELPPYFPADAPVYPGASTNTGAMTGGRARAVFSTPDSLDQVTAWYRTALGEQGWERLEETEVGDHRIIKVEQGRRRLGIMLSTLAGKTVIVVSSDI